MKTTQPPHERIDARTARKDRSRQAILRAYMDLVNETRRQPTAQQITERAGCSLRLVFQHFADLPSLTAAAVEYAYQQGSVLAAATKAEGDRPTRIRAQIAARARNCEAGLPLWHVTVALRHRSPDLQRLIGLVRKGALERLTIMYEPELAALSDVERRKLLIALEAITDFESWGRLRDEHGLTFEQAAESWVTVVDRLLPPTPAAVRVLPERSQTDGADQAASARRGQPVAGRATALAV
jgi:AcrR family transcriptional regulator